MLLVVKLWGLAWAYRDGGMKDEDLTPDQIQRKVVNFPSLLEYSSFVFASCGCCVGPFFEFSDYVNWAQMKGVYADAPRGLSAGWATFIPAMKKLAEGVLCLAIHLAFVTGLGFSVYFCGTPEYIKSGNWGWRFIYYNMAMTGQRFMYYTPWCINDAAMISCGMAYNGPNKDETGYLWDRIVNIYVFELETAATPVKMMGFWNHQISVWLNHYVQGRMIAKGGKPTLAVSLGTFAISAFWHGFYPFYYVMFFMSALFVELSKEIYRCRILFSFIPSDMRHPLANIMTMIILNYFGTSFNALTFERGLTFGAG